MLCFRRPEITIVDARPMSQTGFRDMSRAADAAAVAKPANCMTGDADNALKPSNNGVLPGRRERGRQIEREREREIEIDNWFLTQGQPRRSYQGNPNAIKTLKVKIKVTICTH